MLLIVQPSLGSHSQAGGCYAPAMAAFVTLIDSTAARASLHWLSGKRAVTASLKGYFDA
jgi:hypothetical protein